MAQRQGARVVNDPQGLRDFNEKLAALLFPQCCPPTLVSRDRLGLITSDFTELGLRWRWATE